METSPDHEHRRSEAALPFEEALVDRLIDDAHLASAHELPRLLERHVDALGCSDGRAFLADLQQNALMPFVDGDVNGQATPLSVDSTLAGWVFQRLEVRLQDLPGEGVRVWIPLLDGTDRLGVMAATVHDRGALGAGDGALMVRLRRLASLFAELLVTKTLYSDTTVTLRRSAEMGLAAEIQWSLLPPLTFASREVTIAASLEPAYEVAGDTVDYAINRGLVHAAVFDGMGHGMQAAQLAVLAVTAYRNARRGGRRLGETAIAIDGALNDVFGIDGFATGILAELDTATGELQWLSAGHPQPLLLREGRFVKPLVVAPTLPFGLSTVAPKVGVRIGTEHLQPGDRVVFYTDGAIEARSPDGEFFGVERLTELILRHLASGLAAPETMRRVTRALLDHQQGQLDDDATMLLLEWRSGNEGAFSF
ncbi:serine/threonine-protein phosphatase [Acidiferrimicrobium sp. IK]|uniref:PP2C family protein-serine/threonine phosphatase n=1 Tax=Acidiferrimicrobium sp. IK TaxID=2871700 RepID=UPI0021CB05CC|nr:PP2C family protein-serine/threonine phosphatase [Acidiferrimicrobium sp. IK]MCU4184428.1 serine/threonine-protein phosphatase [Acidiferrimicrobium sp. IK]